ncbi:MAG TPA: PIN domain-containing protein [Pyrinomonadaceae bacterium]|nr:PIN domain-containing protein [Pyrinomonadaceae bacterium]
MTEPSQKPFRTNYVLIDFENVRPDSLEQLDHEYFKLLVFVGASQGCVPYGMVTSLHRFGDRVEYIKISGNGSNALDFHIAYYIGKLAAADPTAYFHIISKDGGYDPLVQHLKSKKIFANRAQTISDIHLVKISNCKTPAQRIELILEKLRRLKSSKPREVQKLDRMIAGIFLRQISDKEVSGLINNMVNKGHLTVSGTKITYAFE